MKKLGSRLQVFRGTAVQTSGGLKKNQLAKNPKGRIVSRKKQQQAKQKSNLGNYLVGRGRQGQAQKPRKPKAKQKPKPKPKPKAEPEEELLDLTGDPSPKKRRIPKKDPLAKYRADQKRRAAKQANLKKQSGERSKTLRKLRAEQKQLRKAPSKGTARKLTKKELVKLKAARKLRPSMLASRRRRVR